MKDNEHVIKQLNDISTHLDGKLSYYIISNSSGDKYKRIQIDYDFNN